MTPTLSIVVTGRNDGYGGDFNSRFIRTLAFNHERLQERNVDHEIVLVEWAPPADRPRLADIVGEACARRVPSLQPVGGARVSVACFLHHDVEDRA